MKNVLVTDIEWDDEGMGLEECMLPSNVVMLEVPDNASGEEIEETASEQLSEAFGFCHKGFNWQVLSPAQDTHAGGGFFPNRLATMRWVS